MHTFPGDATRQFEIDLLLGRPKMHKRVKVLICDDHALFRHVLRTILLKDPLIEVLGEAENGKQVVEMVDRLHPDVVLMDMVMPELNGTEATRRIKKAHPNVQVLILSLAAEEDLVAWCINAGASGYVLKDSPPSRLVYAIQQVAQGRKYLSATLLKAWPVKPSSPKKKIA